MKTKIERYTEKFIDSNFDKKDKKKEISLKFEWFLNSLHCWEYSSQSYNAKNKKKKKKKKKKKNIPRENKKILGVPPRGGFSFPSF